MANIFVLAGISASFVSLKDDGEENHSQAHAFSAWYDWNTLNLIPAQDTKSISQKVIPISQFCLDINRTTFIKKTYHSHNDLHFNLPLISYKFPISQYTCDG